MSFSLTDILALYDQDAPLEMAYTIPAQWYIDRGVADMEREKVFGNNWIAVGRIDQVAAAGHFFTVDLAGEPLIVVRGADNVLRAFYNVCRHHAAAVATAPLRGRPALALPVPRLDLWTGWIAEGRA